MTNEHRTWLAGAADRVSPRLCRAGSKHAGQHFDIGGPDECRDGEEKGKAAYKYVHKEIADSCLGTEMKKSVQIYLTIRF